MAPYVGPLCFILITFTLVNIMTKNKREQIQICARGHTMTAGNIYIRPDGKRACRACIALANKRYHERKRLRLVEEQLSGR